MKTLLKTDISLQWRQGFWLVYFLVSLIYVLILLSIPLEKRMLASLLMILSDTSMLGVLFIGALILLEKQQQVSHSLFVTPLKASSYVWSKGLSLALIATCMSMLVYLPNWQVSSLTPLLLACVAATALGFAFFGLGLAVRLTSVNQYFGQLMLWSVLLMAPVAPYLLSGRHPAFLALPYMASLDLMLGGLYPLPGWRILTDAFLVLLWCALAFRFARNRVLKFLVRA